MYLKAVEVCAWLPWWGVLQIPSQSWRQQLLQEGHSAVTAAVKVLWMSVLDFTAQGGYIFTSIRV